MAILHACLDESGKFKDPKANYISFCGYIAYAHDWEAFSVEWQSLLLHERLTLLHAVDAYQFNGEWLIKKKEWGDKCNEKRDEILSKFAEIIKRRLGPCCGVAVDVEHFRSMSSEFKKRLVNPHYLAFETVVRNIFQDIDSIGLQNANISIICDDEQQYSRECYDLYDKMRIKKPELKSRLTGICFLEDRIYPPLQASDLIAYLTRLELECQKSDSARQPSRLYADLTFLHWGKQPLLYNAWELDKLEASYKQST